jgi:hypothetical protein
MGGTTRKNLPIPVPVFVVYQTAFLDTDGKLQVRPDFYDRDAEIWQQLVSRTSEARNWSDPPHGPMSHGARLRTAMAGAEIGSARGSTLRPAMQ